MGIFSLRNRVCRWTPVTVLCTVLLGAVLLASCAPSAASGPGGAASTAQLDHLAEFTLASRLVPDADFKSANAPAKAGIVEYLARSGDSSAEYLIAEYYLAGTGVDKNPATAAIWMQRAAAGNFPKAKAELAVMYFNGLGVAKDTAHGLQLAQEAAAAGSPDGEAVVGLAYTRGWSVAQNDTEAVKWFRKAADQQSTIAMVNLGYAYRDGKGVPADNLIAEAWFVMASTRATAGAVRDSAIKGRENLALTLLPDDLKQAYQMAGAWKPGDEFTSLRGRSLNASAAANAAPTAATNQTNTTAPVTAAAGTPAKRSDPPIVVHLQTIDMEAHSDGSFIRTTHTEYEVKNEAVAKTFSQIPVWFDDAMEQLEISEAYTLKPDGRKLPVNRSAIFTQLRPGAPSTPMFDSLKQKVVVFPDVQAGDVLVLTSRHITKPYLPGLFQTSMIYDPTAAYNDARVTITAPKSMPLSVETHDLKFTQRDDGANTVYEWRYTQMAPAAENIIALDPRDRWPRLFASSFRNYDRLGRDYAAISEAKSTVTPKVQKLADEITQGVSDRRRQAELIYNWVSRNIRYVGVEIGQEAIVPHDPDLVLGNGYGDCKDHSVLFSALLRAKGIESNVVLINLGESYSLAQAPTFSTLNHAITWLPEFELYADTTAGVAPFGVLPFQEYGKPVVIATTSGTAVRRTPLLAPDAASVATRITAKLGTDGKISADSETTGTGPFAIQMRQGAVAIQAVGAEQAASRLLRIIGYEGTGSFTLTSPYESGPSYQIVGHFDTNPRPELLAGNGFYPPHGMALSTLPGDWLLGSVNFRDMTGTEPTHCFSGRETEELSLELPEGKHLRELPKGNEVANKYLHYKSEWSLSGRIVTVKREFSATVDQPVCIGEIRQIAVKSLNEIRKDYNSQLALVDN